MNGNLDKKNGFLYAKAAVAALCGAFTAAFGWLGWLVLAWAACMALDWLSGSAAAASRGEWSSAAARAGIWHKAGMVVVVCVAALTDLVLNVAVENLPAFGDGVGFDFEGVVLPVVLVWYIFTELGSIAENGAAMGAPVPGQADPDEKNEENSDAAKKLQRISIGPVSRGDAEAVYAVCVSRGLVAAGLYKSEWSV